MFYSKIQENSCHSNSNSWQLKWILRALSQSNSLEISKNANCIIENINSSQSSSLCVNDNLKAILDSNAILKDDDLLCTMVSSNIHKKKLKCP